MIVLNVSLIIGQDRRIPLKVPLDKEDLGGSITEIATFNPSNPSYQGGNASSLSRLNSFIKLTLLREQ